MKKIIVFIVSLSMSSISFAALYARDLDGDFSNGHEGVYDDVLNITWLGDARLSTSQTFGVEGIVNGTFLFDGGMSRNTMQLWLAAMNQANYFGYSGWRLPSVSPVNGASFDVTMTWDGSTDFASQISAPVSSVNPYGQSAGFLGSEMAYHYYNNFGAIAPCYGAGEVNENCPNNVVNGPNSLEGGLFTADNQANISLFENLDELSYWVGENFQLENGSTAAWAFELQGGGQSPNFLHFEKQVWAVHDGDIGAAVVPIPAAAWFFLSSIIGLAGFRKLRAA